MPRPKAQQLFPHKRTRQELAAHFLQLRLSEAGRKAMEFIETLDPRQREGAPDLQPGKRPGRD